MATYGVSHTLTYLAWDQTASAPKINDGVNHTLRWIKDGVSAAPTNPPVEVDSTNAPGIYSVVLTATECQAVYGTLAGKSATANITLSPVSLSFDRLPTVAPGTAGGLPTVDGSNAIAGVQGTLGVNITQISGDVAAADNLELMLDGTGGTLTLGNILSVNTTQLSGDTIAADNLEALLDGTGGVDVKFDKLTGTEVSIINAAPGGAAVSLNASGAGGVGLLLQANASDGVAVGLNDGTGEGVRATGGLAGISNAAATGILSTPANKLVTDTGGNVQLPAVDGVTDLKLREMLLAALAGKTTLTDNGDGTQTLRFFKQNGTTAVLDITFNTNGEWTVTAIDPL